MSMWQFLADATYLKSVTPLWVRTLIRKNFSVLEYDRRMWAKADPFDGLDASVVPRGQSQYTVGIIKEFSHRHAPYIAACREIGIPFQLLDISGSDWIEVIERSQCDGFLAWPSPVMSLWKEMYDERLKIMVDEMNKIIYPSYKELWIYESKRRMRDWLVAHKIPHPQTDIFFDLDEALAFVEKSSFPSVMKTNFGARAKGVVLLRDLRAAKKWIRRAFKKGIVINRADLRDKQWGHVILQEYLPEVREWRLVRIGDSYFGHLKGRVGDFHSGSGEVIWEAPPEDLLYFLHEVTEAGGFSSMCVDVFETRDRRYLVNELQAVFGASISKDQLKVGGKAGRYTLSQSGWAFDEGDFARNACCNLRLQYLIKLLSEA